MVLDFRLDDGAQALDQQQQLDFQRGYQVIDAASGSNLVTPAASGLSVDVASGDILHGGTTVSCPQVTGKSLTSADPDDPRVDVVYRDGNGAVQIKDGAPAPVKPAGGRDRDAYQPAPHDMHDIDGVVLATVWVAAGATSIGSGDIRDRRLPASLDVGTLDATSVSTEEVDTRTRAASYYCYTDGSTIYGIPQQNPAGPSSMEKITDTSIGTFLKELIVNQLPPQGDNLEADGRAVFRRGDYPGDLSDWGSRGAEALVSGVTLEGEVATHDEEDTTTSGIPTTVAPVRWEFSGTGLSNPNDDNGFMVYPMVKNIELVGPGDGTNGSVAVDTTGTNVFDWGVLENVNIAKCERPLVMTKDGHKCIKHCQMRQFAGNSTISKRTYIYDSTWVMTDGSDLKLEECRFIGGGLHGVGEATPMVTLNTGAVVTNARIERIGGTSGNGTVFNVTGDAIATHNHLIKDSGNPNFDRMFRVGGGQEVHIGPNFGLEKANRYADIVGGSDVRVTGNPGGGINLGTTTRPRYNGVIGGGVLGGVDLGSTTPSFDGDVAMADGTSGTAYLFARADTANTQWVQSDGTTVQY